MTGKDSLICVQCDGCTLAETCKYTDRYHELVRKIQDSVKKLPSWASCKLSCEHYRPGPFVKRVYIPKRPYDKS